MSERRVTAEELAAFLEHVRRGNGLHAAARRLKVPYKAVQVAREAYPEFDAAVREAEVEAAEPVETELYAAALRGEPWAVDKWLKQRSPDRWREVTSVQHKVQVELDVGPRLGRIAEIRAELERRRDAVGSVIDVGPGQALAAVRPAEPEGVGPALGAVLAPDG